MSSIRFSVRENLISEVNDNFTSEAFAVDQFKKVGIQMVASGISSGNGVFRVEGTIDGKNWVGLNTLVDNVTNTNSENITHISSKTLSANGSEIVWLLVPALKAIRVGVNRTTDGVYSASVLAVS